MKCAGKKYPQKMEKDHNQQGICTPMVNIADQLTKEHIVLQVNNRLVGALGDRPHLKITKGHSSLFEECPFYSETKVKSQ